MRIAVIDITNKVPLYSEALMKALHSTKESDDTIVFYSSEHHLLSIVPRRIENSKNLAKRALKAFETLLNWCYLVILLSIKKYDVVHFQWLPFLEISSIEALFLRLLKGLGTHQMIFTIHNVYPHGTEGPHAKAKYVKRFRKVARHFNKFIVHTSHTKNQVNEDLGVPNDLIFVVHHGIFEHKRVTNDDKKNISGKYTIIMYGNQDKYKGTDIFVDSLSLLSEDLKRSVSAKIIGRMDDEMYKYATSKDLGIELKIIPHFVPEEELYRNIAESDLIVLPYRDISQSGVLLLALSFNKCILTSDLPSFRETLEGFDDNMFFKVGDAQSMSFAIERFIQKEIDIEKQLMIIDSLNEKYSWESAGRLTYNIYKK